MRGEEELIQKYKKKDLRIQKLNEEWDFESVKSTIRRHDQIYHSGLGKNKLLA